MSTTKKATRKPRTVDRARVDAALAKLDELVARHPELTSKESQERLAQHLDEEGHGKDEDDGSEEDDGQ